MSRRRVFLYTMAIVSFFNSSPRETLSVARRARPPSRSSSPRARVVARRRALPIVARRRRLFRQHHRERVRETARAEHRRPRVALVTTVVPHRVFPQRRQGVVRRRRARRGRAVARGRRCRHPRRARGDAPRGDATRRARRCRRRRGRPRVRHFHPAKRRARAALARVTRAREASRRHGRSLRRQARWARGTGGVRQNHRAHQEARVRALPGVLRPGARCDAPANVCVFETRERSRRGDAMDATTPRVIRIDE